MSSKNRSITTNDMVLIVKSLLPILLMLIYLMSFVALAAADTYVTTDTTTATSKLTISDNTSTQTTTITSKTNYTPLKTDIVYDNGRIKFTYHELDLINLVVQAEAGNQDELGQRYVIDVIFNRLEQKGFPKTIKEVLYAKNAFSVVPNRIKHFEVNESLTDIILDEASNRKNTDILYFRNKHYHRFGTPAFKHQDHYFSTN